MSCLTFKGITEIISFFVIWFLLNANGQATEFNDKDLRFVIDVQKAFCTDKTTCETTKTTTTTTTQPTTTNDGPKFVELPFPTLPISPPNDQPSGMCCGQCSCNINTCQISTTCCPNMLTHLPTVEESTLRTKLSCEMTNLRPGSHELKSGAYTYLMVAKCDTNYSIDDSPEKALVKDKCENSGTYSELATKVPGTNKFTLLNYKNQYCSQCNNIPKSDIQFWNVAVECVHGSDGSSISKGLASDIIPNILKTRSCNLIYGPVSSVFNHTKSLCDLVTTNSCNVTGLWEKYDPVIEAACHAYTSVYSGHYKNIFCLMCNERSAIFECQHHDGYFITDFSVLLNFQPDQEPTSSDIQTNEAEMCSRNQLRDQWKDVCRDMHCKFPKRLENGQCSNIAESLPVAGFRLYLKITPIEMLSGEKLEDTVYAIRSYLNTIVYDWGLNGTINTFKMYYKWSYKSMQEIKASETSSELSELNSKFPDINTKTTVAESTTMIQPELPPQDQHFTTDFPPIVLPSVVHHAEQSSQPNSNEVIKLDNSTAIEYLIARFQLFFSDVTGKRHNVSLIDDIVNRKEIRQTLINKSEGYSESFKFEVKHFSALEQQNGEIYDQHDNQTLTEITSVDPFYPLIYIPYISFEEVTISKTINCPLLKLNTQDFNITELNSGIHISGLDGVIETEYFDKEPTKEGLIEYFVCADKYKALSDAVVGFQNVTIRPVVNNTVSPLAIVTLVCTCLSLVCCLLTFGTYSLFKELRSQPGINNMGLVTALIIAQTLFQFGINQSKAVPEWACQLIGVLVHFFWLMVLLWMNVCSFHMLRVFNSFQKPCVASSSLQTTLIYTIYTIIVSVLFVIINIIVSKVQKTGIGYGGALCYITKPEMIGFVFALPVGIIILTNLGFFVTVIVKMSRMPTIESSIKQDRNNFKIYAKLSSITGIAWIFGFTYAFTQNEFLSYLFAIFNAGQGVFLFFSFICNRRVLGLYKAFYGKHKDEKHTRASDGLKTAETSLMETSNNV